MKPEASRKFDLRGRMAALAAAVPGRAAACWAVLLWLPAAPALAAEGEGSGDPWRDLMWKGLNFAVLMALLVYFGRKPVANLFRNAARRTREELEESREAAREAEAALAEQKAKIEGLQSELVRLREEALAEARDESERILNEARATAERIRTQMRFQVEQEFKKASSQLRQQLADEAVRLAEERLAEQLDEEGRGRLVKDAIDQLGGR